MFERVTDFFRKGINFIISCVLLLSLFAFLFLYGLAPYFAFSYLLSAFGVELTFYGAEWLAGIMMLVLSVYLMNLVFPIPQSWRARYEQVVDRFSDF